MISIIVPTVDMSREKQILKNVGNCGDEVIIVQGRNPSAQRNEGIKRAKGDVLFFCDDDSVLFKECFKKAAEIFSKDKDVGVVGGPSLTPVKDGLIQKTFGAVLSSPWATGMSSARYRKKGKMRETNEKELILCNMFIKREVFNNCGYFREDLYPNEENEFLNRVQMLKYKIIYSPDVYVERPNRKNHIQFFMQCFNYGRGRAEQMIKAFNLNDLINTVPAFFVVYLVLMPITPAIPFKFLPFFAYLFLNFLFSLKAGRENRITPAILIIFLNFFILHVSYGSGFIWGIIKSVFLKKSMDTKTEVKIIKK
ncbi:MAG: glycosyltransferase [Candidatus Goldbacteria bacterium]|nr:glycosyltransferase [Candidatus Goldiibacteriota bacterium]HPD18153.1 glycosyltransferase [Candidatus Goldiibacteriota bacterium]